MAPRIIRQMEIKTNIYKHARRLNVTPKILQTTLFSLLKDMKFYIKTDDSQTAIYLRIGSKRQYGMCMSSLL